MHPLLALVTDVPISKGSSYLGSKRRLCVINLEGTVLFQHFIPAAEDAMCFRWGCSGDTLTFREGTEFHTLVFSSPASLSPLLRPAVHELVGGGLQVAQLGSLEIPVFDVPEAA